MTNPLESLKALVEARKLATEGEWTVQRTSMTDAVILNVDEFMKARAA